MVAVITNGTAILGLGNLGPLASKPVMEGKSLLFKRFAGLDSIDIEVKHRTIDEFVDTVANIADTFGGINLEDIKAPDCFEIEKRLIERCSIPVFHDDQHGTAIVTAAGMLNALEIQGKEISESVIVCLGAGAAAVACMELLIKSGAQREKIYMLDRKGVIHTRRDDINEYKQLFANNTDKRTLEDVIEGADIFVGVSGPNLLAPEALKLMADKPVVFACSNPDPEIKPELAHAVRDDLIMGTGRSDYPNQVNNVICFPFIFRGALDVRASKINDEMKLAAVKAIRELTKEPVPAEVMKAAGVDELEFGVNYIIPKPMDPRLLPRVAKAVAQAAIDSGVAQIDMPVGYMES
jgi:malate dehydrogenase (oxaloacetate-decarboxylating)(NADP+)